ncbi:exopolysaccharide biosynthesis protein YbjH [Panacagrimonas perspica]|uniref:Exopolysaccharide biosynthesis protein YbjH n=1 Tax=Panacagrimonas perspica TaxID=381431 RepID=A0A4V3URT1_9GAMM|nr:YjbH domain-containing protein [Panacagrimonas perspica]TDU26645.1 exopolysaccharide biosynthesis protein YbjH [Panacagrimonas perspica]THD04001.1 hypothetical protein B1810_06995 [Panacagrimonas perspica]
MRPTAHRRNIRTARAAALVASLVTPYASAAEYADWSSNDFGGIGLIQTPTARFAPDGEFRVGVSTADPYNQILFGMQLLPWLEAGFRYAEVKNRLYGPESFSGDQSYKDRSIDLKLRLREESPMLPAFAFGVLDIGGTGLFASEYLVASKQVAGLDWTLGLAWGRMGARGGIRNPFAVASDKFEDRPATEARGDVGLERMFGGHDVGLFGGVQWQTPLPHLSLKLEYDGNDYKSEALDNNLDADSPVNVALNYRLGRNADVSAGLERGNTFMARFVMYTNFHRDRGPDKVLDPPSTPLITLQPEQEAALAPSTAVDADFFERVKRELARQKIQLVAMDSHDLLADIQVWFTQDLSDDEPRVIGRIGQTLAMMAPPQYYTFTLSHLVAGAESYRVRLQRDAIDAAIDFDARPATLRHNWQRMPTRTQVPADVAFKAPSPYPSFDWYTGPALRQHIGGPDDFYFGQLWWRLGGRLALSPRWSLSGQVGADIYNNFDGLKQTSDSRLPKVRSDIVRYLKEGENNLVRLETNYVWSPRPSWYARLSGGIFEEMYGGIAGEVLYRRPEARWAVGLDVNRVRQRDFDQRFSFRDYEVTTGHLTGYFQLPFYGMSAQLSAGRYLAGDKGGTLELSRRFASGVSAGLFATKTDVSSEDFGEGSFDKGFFVIVPFDLFFARSSSNRTVPLVFRPLTRDGGQRVRDGVGLFGLTESGRLDPDADWSNALR